MDYRFNLEWDDLPEDLREQKILEYIEAGDKDDCEECDGDGMLHYDDGQPDKVCTACNGSGRIAPDPDDLKRQRDAERDIASHFPIYF